MENMVAHNYWLILLGSLIIRDAVDTTTGNHMECYVCSVSSQNHRMDTTNPCIVIDNTTTYPQPCASDQAYCQVTKTVRYDQMIALERKCASSFDRGCIRYAYAVSKMVCTDCCNTSRCNSHGDVSRSVGDYWLIMLMLSFHIGAGFAPDLIVHRFESK